MVKGRTKLYIEQWAGAVLLDGLLVTEQKTSPHRRSTHVPAQIIFSMGRTVRPGVEPTACFELPAVLVVAHGIATQSVVQASPTYN